jgi:hypothetical protein
MTVAPEQASAPPAIGGACSLRPWWRVGEPLGFLTSCTDGVRMRQARHSMVGRYGDHVASLAACRTQRIIDAPDMLAELIRWLGGLDEQFPAV